MGKEIFEKITMKSQIHTQLDAIVKNFKRAIEARKDCEIEMKPYFQGQIDAYESCLLSLGFLMSDILAAKGEE